MKKWHLLRLGMLFMFRTAIAPCAKLGGASGIAAFVKTPSGAMPRLFPGVITEQDVASVSDYVASLK